MQLVKIGEHIIDVETGVGTLWVPRKLRDLPTTELGEDRAGQRITFVLQGLHFLADVDVSVFGGKLQVANLRF